MEFMDALLKCTLAAIRRNDALVLNGANFGSNFFSFLFNMYIRKRYKIVGLKTQTNIKIKNLKELCMKNIR